MNQAAALAAFWVCLLLCAPAARAERLAVRLSREGDHPAAALEFRRLALTETNAEARATQFWLAAYHYARLHEWDRAEKMLDRSEDASPAAGADALFLRSEIAATRERWDESAFYLKALKLVPLPDDLRTLTARRAAESALRRRDPAEAREHLLGSPAAESRGLSALDVYWSDRDRSPRLGGAAGLIPGMGYAYSGEYANALRSLILNGLFGFAMWHTGREEQWGAFAAVSFFEITWYTGSIYGGIDAAHRYNRNRIEDCIREMRGDASYEPDYDALPLLKLHITF